MALLVKNEELSFLILKKKLQVTDGNLSSHLKKLEKEGFIVVEKFFENKKPKTTIKITQKGKSAFKEYLLELKKFVDENLKE